MHAIRSSRPTALAALASLALVACSMSHGSGEDAGLGSLGDGGPGGGIDGGPASWLRDSGGPGGRRDSGSHLVDAAGPLPIDASWFPRPDAMPPRHDAMTPGDRAGDVWEGYVESYAFPSGSDRVRIVFDSASGDGPRTGMVVFGDGPLLPPATDPNVGYPSTLDPDFGSSRGAFEGFEYPISSASVSLGGTRVQVRVPLAALWTTWCELQTSYPWDPTDPTGGNWGCVPNLGGGGGGGRCFLGEDIPIDCGKFALCQPGWNVCECNSAGCTSGNLGEVQIDFSVSGVRGDGTIELHETRNIHVVRAP